jgi:hypothetical protein
MTDRQKKIDAITDSMYYYMIELTSLASELESIELEKDGDDLRGIADQLERCAIRIMNRKRKRKPAV